MPDATVCPDCGEARPLDLKHRLMAEAALTPEDLQSDALHQHPTAIAPAAEALQSRPSLSLAESMAQIDAQKQQERDSIQQHLKTMASHAIAPADQHLFSPPIEQGPDEVALYLKPKVIVLLLLWLLLSLILQPHAGSAPSLGRVFIPCLPLYIGLCSLFWASFGEFLHDFSYISLIPRIYIQSQKRLDDYDDKARGFLKVVALFVVSYGGTVAVYHHYYGTMPTFQH